MRSLMVAVVVLSGVLVLTGCARFSHVSHPEGVSAGNLVGDVTYPVFSSERTEFKFDTDDFVIVRTVTAEASSSNVLGLFGSGDNGYGKLFEEARAAGADDVINIKVDTREQKILIGFYTKATTKLTGTAIKWKR